MGLGVPERTIFPYALDITLAIRGLCTAEQTVHASSREAVCLTDKRQHDTTAHKCKHAHTHTHTHTHIPHLNCVITETRRGHLELSSFPSEGGLVWGLRLSNVRSDRSSNSSTTGRKLREERIRPGRNQISECRPLLFPVRFRWKEQTLDIMLRRTFSTRTRTPMKTITT